MAQAWREISKLTKDMSDGTVTKRREAFKKLRHYLNETRTREQLLQEASGKKALCAVWNTVIAASVVAADKALSKKFTKDDIAIPYYMLLRMEEFAKFANTDSLLGSTQLQAVLKYCINSLSNEAVCDVAEDVLLNMLEHLCSKPDFLGYLTPDDEMQPIMSELQERLENPDHAHFDIAAKAFCSLFTTAKKLGTGMHLLIPCCLAVIDTWCRDRLTALQNNEIRTNEIFGLESLFGAAAAALSTHPEHAIYEFSLRGRCMLRLARKCYPHATTKKTKEALIEYFLAHLLVCQTAGKLQGLLPGDLGDVGKASLDKNDVMKLIAMTVTDTDIDKVRIGNDVSKSQTRRSRTPLTNREQSLEPTDLSRRHFELCARLLACSQRQYLADAEWEVMKQPVDDYRESIPPDPHPEATFVDPLGSNVFESCSQSDFVNSTWMSSVGLPLWSFCDNVLAREASQLDAVASQETSIAGASSAFPPQSDIQHFSSVLQEMSSKMYDQAARSPVPFLQLVCACAETFPMGQCWTSNTQRNWQSVTPNDLLSTEEKLYSNGCSPDDIALVVSLVANILEANGGPDGNQQTQRWALTCLIRLSESSDLVATAAEQRGESSPILHVVWQRVWHTLFRTDLRYASYTRRALKDSLGELVLVLLTEMVKRRTTDPLMRGDEGISTAQTSIGDFVNANQEQVWTLEVFSDADSIDNQAVFDLVAAILHCAGLSEVGTDQIDDSGPVVRLPPEVRRSVPTSSRRYRLSAFSLRYLERVVSDPDADKSGTTEAACFCLISLMTGKSTQCLSTFDKAASVRAANVGDSRKFFCATNIAVDQRDRKRRDSTPVSYSLFLRSLWDNDVDSLPKSWLQNEDSNNDLTQSIEFDNSELEVSRELLGIGRQPLGDRHCDFVSPGTASALHEYGASVLMKLSEPPSDSNDEDYEFDESVRRDRVSSTSMATMIQHISILRLLMSFAFSSATDDDFKQSEMERLEGRISSTFDEIIAHFPSATHDDSSCATLLTRLFQVLQGMSAISLSIDAASIPVTISTRLESLFYMCRRMIREYSQSRGSGSPIEPPEEHPSRDVLFDSDEEMDQKADARARSESDSDDSGVTSGRKRKSGNSWKRGKKRRTSKDSATKQQYNCPCPICANRLASILVLLQPSYGVCKAVADAIALSRTEGSRIFGEHSSTCDSNVGGALHCLKLFCSPLVIHRGRIEDADSVEEELPDPDADEVPTGTVVYLCGDLVQDIRSEADPGSRHFLFGFEVCAYLVHEQEKIGGVSLESVERHNVVEILLPGNKSEQRALKRRPDLRARQLAATISVFRDASDQLHEILDGQYKKDIVPGLVDRSASVRKLAACAVGEALLAFTQQGNIVNGVKKKLPPLLPKDGISTTDLFREWSEKNRPKSGSGDNNDEEDDSVWRDLFVSVQSFAINVNGVIVGSTTDRELFRDCLFDIVLLASQRPDVEGVCYHACDKAARLIGFSSVQQLLMSECEYICTKWTDTGKLLQEMPLLLTAPTVLLRLLLAGTAKSLFGNGALNLSRRGANESQSEALAEVRRAAATDYVERSASLLVPIICRKKALAAPGNDYLEEITNALSLPQDSEGTRILLKSHFADVLAYVEPLIHSVNEDFQKDGKAIVKYLESQLPSEDYDTLREKYARLAVHQLLCSWGKDGNESESHNLTAEVVQEAILALAHEGTSKHKAPFAAIGSSATEYILHARFWLAQSVLVRQKKQRWSAIELIFSLVLKYVKQNGDRLGPMSQLGFCLNTICEILADPTLSSIYPAALKTLDCFVSEALSLKFPSTAEEEISPVLYRLIGTLVTTHERFQDALLEKCLSSWIKQRGLQKCSSGLRRSAMTSRNATSDVWGWDSESANTKEERIENILVTENMPIDDSLRKTLTRTHGVLKKLFQNLDAFRGGSAMPMKCLDNFASGIEAYNPISLRDSDLCARSLVQKFVEDESGNSGTISAEECVSTFLKVSKTLLGGHVGRRSGPQRLQEAIHEITSGVEKHSKPSLNSDFQLLLGELTYVQESIERSTMISPMEFGSCVDVVQEKRYSLVNILLKLCEASYPEDIRAAASRCLGALGPSDVENLASVELELAKSEAELFQASQKDGDLLANIKSSCLKSLGQYLLSPLPETAIAALEAAKAILAAKESKQGQGFLDNEDTQRLLDPLLVSKKISKPKSSTFVAPAGYLESLLAKVVAGDVALSTDDPDKTWCWHEALWLPDRNGALSYEDWVKFITCAMITCCYTEEKKGGSGNSEQIRGKGMFFRYCIKLCTLEHEFAAKVFSGIVLDLLLNEIDCSSSGERLASKNLSKCFSALIGSKNGTNVDEVEKSSISIQALSLAVDTIDMIRFIMQKRFDNMKHKRNSFDEHIRKASAKRGKIAKRLQTPNGIVLHLNGLSVARACIQANRFASALFYADMHSDRCYDGGAGGILERLSNGKVKADLPELDISGFDDSDGTVHESDSMEVDPNNERDSEGKLVLPSILQQSYTALRDLDAAGAVSLERAAMRFLDAGFKWNASNSLHFDTLERLKALDLQCQDQYGRITASQRVIDCMEDIGLESVLQIYTTGLLAGQGDTSFPSLSPVEQVKLRDGWFRGRLQSMQWDGEFFSGSFAQEPPQSHGVLSGPVSSGVGFHEGLSKALSSFMKDDVEAFRRLLSQARGCLIENLSRDRKGEAPLRGLIDTFEKLQLLNDVETLSDEESCVALAKRWQAQNEKVVGDRAVDSPVTTTVTTPRLSESGLWAREILLRVFQGKESYSREELKGFLVPHLWQLGSIARLVGRSDVADSSLQRLHTALHLTGGQDNDKLLRVRFEEAMIMESRGDFSSAIRGLKLISNHLGDLKAKGDLQLRSEALYADALLLCGEWMNRYKVEPGKAIMNQYLKPSVELAEAISEAHESSHNTRRSFAAHLALAELTSGLFESICRLVEAPEWGKAGANIEMKRGEIKTCQKLLDEALKKEKTARGKAKALAEQEVKDLAPVLHRQKRELENMMKERQATEAFIPDILEMALKSYCSAICRASHAESSDVSTHVYRLVSLWFGNCDHPERAKSVNDIMGMMVVDIPSFRFVPLAYQIFARLASGSAEFQKILNDLIHTMCLEHPYHCLIQLFALANGGKVGTRAGADANKENVEATGKVDAALEIIAGLEKEGTPVVRGLVQSYRQVVDAYIELALADPSAFLNKKQTKDIPLAAFGSVSRSLSLKGLTFKPCVVTKPPAINPGAFYDDGIRDPVGSELIKSFNSKLWIASSGNSKPKFIKCIGSSGMAYQQVVKGNDDCRGDAVMQQVFCFVNNLMKRRNTSEKEMGGSGITHALKDELNIVTYHIVPLSPSTGVLEFVEDSIAFGEYLVDRGSKLIGAHSKYNPGEWGYAGAKDLIDKAKPGEQRKVYDEICENFSPVFRHFFTERFGHSLPLWYASKMKYTRSCAVSSMVGHMLGIGDRHIYNILIREKTGEVVHIDFGILFEQGKLLPHPETVPFRLSRDIVDGMGPCGTEGTFTRAAEQATIVLRENSDALLTILSAVVSDPLFVWNMTPREARRRQRADNEDANSADVELEDEVADAEDDTTSDDVNEAGLRALARIQEKLQGYEDGSSGERQSVEGQVQMLINAARDEGNLCRLFHGWSAHV